MRYTADLTHTRPYICVCTEFCQDEFFRPKKGHVMNILEMSGIMAITVVTY